jgi:Ca2+/Na+ antiporter
MHEVNSFNSDAAKQIASGGLWMRVMFFTAIVFLLLGLTRVESLLLQVNQLLDGILFSSSYWMIGAFFLAVMAGIALLMYVLFYLWKTAEAAKKLGDALTDETLFAYFNNYKKVQFGVLVFAGAGFLIYVVKFVFILLEK